MIFFFDTNNDNIKNIYNKYELNQKEGLYFYQKVFKLFIKSDEILKEKKVNLSFEIGLKFYTISLNIDDKSFYYDIKLTKEYKYLPIPKSNEDQNNLNYYQKLEIFIAALKENKEEEKIDNLYKETIKLFSKKKKFYLLISLFINIYDKPNLCTELMEEFQKINKEKNYKIIDKKEDSNNYLPIPIINGINKILSDADKIIKNQGYNPINFYGIIFSYLNYYDYENFKKYWNKLYNISHDNLYEILIIYYPSFLKPIIQDISFFENFFDYIIKKSEFDIFENSLNCISDIETFIDIINKKKEILFEKYGESSFKTIIIKSSLAIN